MCLAARKGASNAPWARAYFHRHDMCVCVCARAPVGIMSSRSSQTLEIWVPLEL